MHDPSPLWFDAELSGGNAEMSVGVHELSVGDAERRGDGKNSSKCGKNAEKSPIPAGKCQKETEKPSAVGAKSL